MMSNYLKNLKLTTDDENLKLCYDLGKNIGEVVFTKNLHRSEYFDKLVEFTGEIGGKYNNLNYTGKGIEIAPAIRDWPSIKKISETAFEISTFRSSTFPITLFEYAHILGHLFIHMRFRTPQWENKHSTFESNTFYDTPLRDRFYHEEGEANVFALGMLLPDDWYDDNLSIKELSKKFHVPERYIEGESANIINAVRFMRIRGIGI
jgi:hypothetical protein